MEAGSTTECSVIIVKSMSNRARGRGCGVEEVRIMQQGVESEKRIGDQKKRKERRTEKEKKAEY